MYIYFFLSVETRYIPVQDPWLTPGDRRNQQVERPVQRKIKPATRNNKGYILYIPTNIYIYIYASKT